MKKAKKAAPCVIFIDEVDLLGSRVQADQHKANIETLGTLWTQITRLLDNKQIVCLLIGATNLINTIDTTLRDRFDREIKIDVPNAQGRKKILQYYLAKIKNKAPDTTNNDDIRKFAKKSLDLFSSRGIQKLVKESGQKAARVNKNEPLRLAHLKEAAEELKPKVLQTYFEWLKKQGEEEIKELNEDNKQLYRKWLLKEQQNKQ